MNDADCNIHNIQWSTAERGEDCPACLAENKLTSLEQAAREYVDAVNMPNGMLQERAQKFAALARLLGEGETR